MQSFGKVIEIEKGNRSSTLSKTCYKIGKLSLFVKLRSIQNLNWLN